MLPNTLPPLRLPPVPEQAEACIDFASRVLRAVTNMAARSRRSEADLVAALQAAGLPIDVAGVRTALQLLQDLGCVRRLVPLSDGGLLLTVTGHAMQLSDEPSPWLSVPEHAAPELGAASASTA
jgi:hypothetical protein